MIFKTTASLLVLAWASAAAAPTPPAGARTSTSAAATQPQADSADVIGEVIVTAQRRSERLVDVPISVATASAEDLQRAGPTSIENLTKITPGVYLQRAVYGLSPTVRGIGSTLATSGGEQNVALYVDEIYYPTPTGNIFDLASVAGVEVLKGPQGTLFGRNATGGAILLRTLDPTFTGSGKVKASWERFDQVRGSAYVNLPLTDKVAVNGSVAYRHSDGYVQDLKTGRATNAGDNFTARAKLLVQPTDAFSVVFTAAHADFDDPSGGDTRNFKPARAIAILGGGPVASDRYHSSMNTQQFIKTKTDEYSARAKLDVAGGVLSSFTAFLRNDLNALNDLDLSYLDQTIALHIKTKTFSQEVNFASAPNQPLTYVVGAYYFHNRGQVPSILSNNKPLANSQGKIDAIAGYADGTYEIGDLSLIAGLRYSYEKRRTNSAFGVLAPSPYTRFQEAVDKQWTPRVGLRYRLDGHSNLYATYSKGFKSGVFDATTAAGPGVKPEKVDAYEVGLKSASGDFTFNTAAFYYDYLDTQVNATISGANGAVFTQLFNVPKSRIYGAEAEAWLRLGESFDVRGAVAYTHSRYVDFPNAPGYVDNPANPTTAGGLLFANVSLNVSGKKMVRSPEFTASSTLRYHTRLTSDAELELTLSPYYSSRVYFTFDNSLSQKNYTTLDAAATLTLHDSVKFSVFGRNLTDEKYFVSKSQNSLSLDAGRYATPATFGVSLEYAF
jgi:iron complex outermembrane recepter protein